MPLVIGPPIYLNIFVCINIVMITTLQSGSSDPPSNMGLACHEQQAKLESRGEHLPSKEGVKMKTSVKPHGYPWFLKTHLNPPLQPSEFQKMMLLCSSNLLSGKVPHSLFSFLLRSYQIIQNIYIYAQFRSHTSKKHLKQIQIIKFSFCQ